MKILLLILLFVQSSIKANNIFTLNEGLYSSTDKGCSEKNVLFIKRKNEQFYLIGNNQRFLIAPSKKNIQEVIRGCKTTFESKIEKNTITQKETQFPCVNIKLNKTIKNKIIKSTILKRINSNEFKLINENECNYKRVKNE